MAIPADIEILERRWQENPTGLLFAPLAEAYRKDGQWQRALEILEAGLAKHAEYVPALIVRGRCQLDAEDLGGAEQTFQQALDRDPVNSIALRGIADVFERTGRPAEAITRLEFLLEVDRGDSEARNALSRLLSPPAPVAPAAHPELPEVAEDLAPSFEEPGQLPEPFEVPDPLAEWAPTPVEEPLPEAPADELVEPKADLVSEREEGEDRPEMAAEADAPASPWQSWASWESWGSPPPEPLEAPGEEPPVSVEKPAVEEPAELAVEELAVEAPVAEEPEAPLPFTPMEAPAEAVQSEAAPEEAELVITESMAELFLRQGHHDLALAVYRQLVVKGDSPHLEAEVARLEAERVLVADQAAPEPASGPAPRFGAAETGGQSVDGFLRAVLEAPPPAGVPGVLPPAIERGPQGAPTQASDKALTLSAVFGGAEEGPRSVAGAPAHPVEPEPQAAEPSYDEFFGAPAADAEPSPSTSQGVEVEDLKQFNEWLRGLQR